MEYERLTNKIIAVDFDGTLFKDKYPEIGEPNCFVIEWCKRQQSNGAILILWTCRAGKDLQAAVDACAREELSFDYINEGTKEQCALYGGVDTRKVYADLYIDDKALPIDGEDFETRFKRWVVAQKQEGVQ